MKFTPLKFQGSLAAAGMALMPFNFLKSTVYKGEGVFTLSKISSWSLSSFEYSTTLLLIVLMFAFIAIHLILTVIFLKELFVWLFKTNGFNELIKNPLSNSAIFSPLISISMTMVVILGPVSFFVPQISANMHSLMLPGLIFFIFLWVLLISLEIKVVKTMFTEFFEYDKLNFGWLLDVLAIGAVSLYGSGIATSSNNTIIGSIAAFMTIVSLLIGIVVFALKIALLFHQQIKSKVMPDIHLLPAYFLVIPPMCLLWFSFYKVLVYVNKVYVFDISTISFMIIVFAYVTTISWWIFLIVLLNDYFKNKFITSDFSPAQWGMV
ncbi:hypothetical protein CCE28_05625 [Anaeromicrobium sediminis]|uniref:C4-dicarboxylate ABC transporter n=2 Tax=Anaeromicrobium sediminis TaxID=1478221 RepID=A0A267ML91_9FIRM|nr:hypothetical protein [Anaeromicrobium sediminis]PAB60374.1 hypothetical protein CCE28_05625 [Anaeromicrobium sediminis]